MSSWIYFTILFSVSKIFYINIPIYKDFTICLLISLSCMVQKQIKESETVSYKSQNIAIWLIISLLGFAIFIVNQLAACSSKSDEKSNVSCLISHSFIDSLNTVSILMFTSGFLFSSFTIFSSAFLDNGNKIQNLKILSVTSFIPLVCMLTLYQLTKSGVTINGDMKISDESQLLLIL